MFLLRVCGLVGGCFMACGNSLQAGASLLLLSISPSAPLASLHVSFPLSLRPMTSRCGLFTRLSVAPASTRNRSSRERLGSPSSRSTAGTRVASSSGLPGPHPKLLFAAYDAKPRRGGPSVFQGDLLQIGGLGPRSALQTVGCVRIAGSGHAITPPTMALLSSEIVTPPATNTPLGLSSGRPAGTAPPGQHA